LFSLKDIDHSVSLLQVSEDCSTALGQFFVAYDITGSDQEVFKQSILHSDPDELPNDLHEFCEKYDVNEEDVQALEVVIARERVGETEPTDGDTLVRVWFQVDFSTLILTPSSLV